VGTDVQTSASDWGRLIAAVTGTAHSTAAHDTGGALALAMSLGSTVAPDSLACSVTQITGTGFRTPVWSNALALDLDRAQYDSGTGPCIATAQDGEMHAIDVMAHEDLYPAFTAAALHRGVRCSLSLPLPGRAGPSALNLYARTTSAYDSPRTRATAELLAQCVGTLLADDPAARHPGLDGALVQHDLMDRAQAELISRGAADATEAYTWMTQLSRSENCSIFAIAADLVGDADGNDPRRAERP
jgi:hypothetical protein